MRTFDYLSDLQKSIEKLGVNRNFASAQSARVDAYEKLCGSTIASSFRESTYGQIADQLAYGHRGFDQLVRPLGHKHFGKSRIEEQIDEAQASHRLALAQAQNAILARDKLLSRAALWASDIGRAAIVGLVDESRSQVDKMLGELRHLGKRQFKQISALTNSKSISYVDEQSARLAETLDSMRTIHSTEAYRDAAKYLQGSAATESLRLLDKIRIDSFSDALKLYAIQRSPVELFWESTKASTWIEEYLEKLRDADFGAIESDHPPSRSLDMQDSPALLQFIFNWATENKIDFAKAGPILLVFFALFLRPVWDIYIQDYYGKPFLEKRLGKASPDAPPLNIKLAVKEALSELKSETRQSLFYGLGVITRQRIGLHQNPKQKSPRLLDLDQGQVVTILREERNWTEVEIGNENTKQHGWVLRRYVLKPR